MSAPHSFWRRTRIHRDPGLKIFFRREVHVQSFQSPCTARPELPSDFISVNRANQELNNAFLDESLYLKRNQSYDLLKFWGFYEFRVIFGPITPYMGIQKAAKHKNVTTLSGHILASFWARDSSKKALFSSWLALSTGMKSEGSAARAVHVQGDWKLCTCTARRKKILKPGSRWIRILRQKLYPGVKNLGNWRNFCKQLGSALSDSTMLLLGPLPCLLGPLPRLLGPLWPRSRVRVSQIVLRSATLRRNSEA